MIVLLFVIKNIFLRCQLFFFFVINAIQYKKKFFFIFLLPRYFISKRNNPKHTFQCLFSYFFCIWTDYIQYLLLNLIYIFKITIQKAFNAKKSHYVSNNFAYRNMVGIDLRNNITMQFCHIRCQMSGLKRRISLNKFEEFIY